MSNLDFISAADTTNMQAGGTSLFEDLGDVFTKGVGAAVVSGLNGIANTGIDLSNKVFGTEQDKLDTGEMLSQVDDSWGDYYKQHQGAIDTTGFMAASLIPGTLAVKGLKLMQGGQAFGAFGRVLGATSRLESSYLSAALTDVGTEGGTLFTRINTNKALSMAWGVADNVLQTAAFETATALTMKSSPMLENEDWKNVLSDIVTTSLAGGVIGGGIGALFTNKIYKDAGKAVEKQQRLYDTLKNTGDINIAFGDKSFSIIDAVLNLPEKVLDPMVKLTHGRKDLPSSLDTTNLMNKTLRDSVQRGMQQFEGSLTGVVENDVTVGRPFALALVDLAKRGLESKASTDEIRQTMGDYLHNLVSVEGIGGKPLNASGELRFLKVGADSTLKDVFTNVKGTGDVAYRVIGDESLAKMGTLGKDFLTPDEGYKAGFDFVFDPQKRSVQVSPFSKIYSQVAAKEADFAPSFFNTRTQLTSLDTVPTIADVQTTFNKLAANVGGVSSGDRTFKFSVTGYNGPVDSVEATARHYWYDNLPKINGQISTTDISGLDAVLQYPDKVGNITIKDAVTGAVHDLNEIPSMESFVFQQKYNGIIKALEDAGADGSAEMRDLAYRFNVEPAWLDKAVTNQFNLKELYNDVGWKRDIGSYGERENLLLRYDTAAKAKAQQFPDGYVAYQTRVKEATTRAQDAARVVIGDDYALLASLDEDAVYTANSQSVGATVVGSSNANYSDKLRAWSQYTGLQFSNMLNKRVSDALLNLQGPAANLLQNPKAAAEVSAVVASLRLSTKQMALYTDSGLGGSQRYLVDLESFRNMRNRGGPPAFAESIPLSEDAGNFLQAHHDMHAQRIDQQKVLGAAQGMPVRWDPDQFYVPPVDTQRVPFFAFVKQGDGTIFGSSDVAMITAKDAKDLAAKAAAIEGDGSSNLKVIYKANTEEYHKAKGDYDFGRTMNQPQIDSELRKQGKLGDYLPNMTPQAVVEDFVQYTQRAETKLLRDAYTVNYGQTFAELQDLSARYTAAQTSKMEGMNKWMKGAVDDPFGDYQKLALNISKQGEFTLLHQANEFVDALGTRAFRSIEKNMIAAREGNLSWQEANEQMTKFGLGAPFKDQMMYDIAQSAGDRNILKVAFQKANMLLANGMLRLDFANSLLNTISTPVLLGAEVSALRNSIKNDPEIFAAFNKNLSQNVPGTEINIPSTTRLIFNAVGALASKDSGPLYERFRAIGTVKGEAALFHEMMGDISLTPNLVPSEWAKKVDGWVDKGAKLTFSTQAEDATRFVTSHVMMQITDPLVQAGKMTVQEQNAFMTIFTNRVQGNYVASQRPILFQGTIGSAIGLFQTYQFNMFQQIFRHIENKDMKTLAVLGGLQGSLFGANGLPMFDAINTHIVGSASINEGHKDAYSYATSMLGKQWGDWMMYGTASAFPLWSEQAPALYTRGDLNPRSPFIIPTSPMDVPAVSMSLKLVQNVMGMAKQVGNGASVTDALLFGMEHNGINRPLAGLAQVLKGSATTSKGDLISAAGDMNSIATAARLIGAKPMDESLAINTMYRSRAYQAMDKQKIDDLGSVVKDKLRNNQSLSPEDLIDFQGRYAAAGGRIQGYQQAIQRWDKASNTSVVNEVLKHSQTPAGQRLNEVLGGDPLRDYRNQVPDAGVDPNATP